MNKPRILVTFGTRPEAIKMFPVIEALREHAALETLVAVTAQHRELLDQVLDLARIVPDIDLDLMRGNQTLDELVARILTRFGAALDELRPDRVLVHGDTVTTMACSIACYFRKIRVGHVEAGLRSGDIYAPWPEEINRKIAGAIADLHFAPTARAAAALERENVAKSAIHVTGNTVIDALLKTRERIAGRGDLTAPADRAIAACGAKRILLVTAHRRENFGQGMKQIAEALTALARRGDVAIVYPLHPNPQVSGPMRAALGSTDDIHLIEPLEYPGFVRMIEACHLILTDSGGIQEEAPTFGKPVLVMREVTERGEAIEAGTARLVGADRRRIVEETERLLDREEEYRAMAQRANPFGDGHAARRIAALVAQHTH